MKNIFFIVLLFFQVNVYSQFDTLKLDTFRYYYKPKHFEWSFPKNDGLIYDQYIGETISGIYSANGWRNDTINGGYNKTCSPSNNPYIESSGDYILLNKKSFDNKLIFYRYKNGEKFNDRIIDTLCLDYTPPVILGIHYGNPYYESKSVRVIFQADCINGLIQGKGKISLLNTSEIISECYFEDGEIIGKSISKGIYTKNILTTTYKKGSDKPINKKEIDNNGQDIIENSIENDLTLKASYSRITNLETLLNMNKNSEEYKLALQSLTHETFLKNPYQLALYYIEYSKTLQPIKEYIRKNFNIKEVLYNEFKIIHYSFIQHSEKSGATISECYDLNNNLVMIYFQDVLEDEVKNLNHRAYYIHYRRFINFYEYTDGNYGNFLITYKYDQKKNIVDVSKFGLYSRTSTSGSISYWYHKDLTDIIKNSPLRLYKSVKR